MDDSPVKLIEELDGLAVGVESPFQETLVRYLKKM